MDAVPVPMSVIEIILLGIQVSHSLVDFYSAYKTQRSDVAYSTKKLEHLLSVLELLRGQLTNRRFRADEQDLLKNIEGCIHMCEALIQKLQRRSEKFKDSSSDIRAGARTAAHRVAYPFRQSMLHKLDESIDEIASHISLALQVLRHKDIGRVQDIGEGFYSPLTQGSIRLLSLLPHEDTNAPLRCRLFDYPLQDSSEGTHMYEASSHVWGDPKNNRYISINEYDLSITANLYAALLHLRAPFLERIIWIDAICINQDDETEKGEQIRFMAEIYSKASRVVVWLGGPENDSDRALEMIHLLANGTSAELLNSESNEHAILPLLRRPWFRRIWVLQEVAAARNILIKCGSAEIDGYAFGMALDSRSFDPVYKAFPELQIIRPITYLIREAALRPKSIPRSSGRFSLNIRNLGELIDMYHTHGATKQHDKIFALLGMSRDDPSVSGFSLDYTDPWEILFEQLIKFLLNSQVSVKIWAEMTAVIGSKGWVLGKVSSVERDGRDDQQQVAITSKDASGYLRRKGKWALQPSAKSVQAGDIICLLRGALNPTIIRPCKDHFSVIMIAAPLKDIGTGDGSLEQVEPIFFLHDFLLVWNWETERPNGEIGHLDKRTKSWDAALILEEAEEYEKADERLRDAAEIDERKSGEEDPHILTSEKREMKKWKRAKMKLLLEQRGVEVPITESVAIAVARNEKSGEAVMRVLLKQRRDEVPIAESVAVAAARNEKSGEAMIRLLLEQRRNKFPITESVAVAAAMNKESGEAIIRLLLEQKADGVYIENPLLWFTAKGFEAVARLLLEKGADLEARDRKQRTPLMWAAAYKHEAVAGLLLEKGADLEAKDRYQQTPLIKAAIYGREAVARLLLKKGADLETKDINQRTPLITAVVYRRKAVARLLLEKGADLEARDINQRTPLIKAAAYEHEAVARLLLEKGANLEAKDKYQQTPLIKAAIYGREAIARLLLEKGANFEARDINQQTPLIKATIYGREDVARLLLQYGADIKARDENGQTPLMYATDGVKRLLQ